MTDEDNSCQQLPTFKRNNYFYGKLVSVADFQEEQNYFINKLRLINRLIHGKGIICGLELTADKPEGTIRVNEGFALDGYGREIILSKKITYDLNQMYKPEDVGKKRDLFATIEYEETKVDPTPAIGQEETQYNMILEGVRIEFDRMLPDSCSMDKILLAKISVKTNRNKIYIQKIEKSTKLNATISRDKREDTA
ncbi:MAG TPA: hypothetical protein VK209_03005 [Candidatus Sulfotelmatobacter sp.]|nr:hypothetical protein [Candidatus Sulfotelmatobacter sp.]